MPIYKDNVQNRKLKRVGMSWGKDAPTNSAPVKKKEPAKKKAPVKEYIIPLDIYNKNIEKNSGKSRQFIWVNNMYIYQRGMVARQNKIIGKMSNEDFEDFEEGANEYHKYNLYDIDLDDPILKKGITKPIFTPYGKSILKKQGFIK